MVWLQNFFLIFAYGYAKEDPPEQNYILWPGDIRFVLDIIFKLTLSLHSMYIQNMKEKLLSWICDVRWI
jgi:hypothetical protein